MITFNTIGKYGRFGNQMFQYATLYSIAKEKGYEFGVPLTNRSADEYEDFCLQDCFKNLSAKNSTGTQQKHFIQEKSFSFEPGFFGIPDNSDIAGYFQSEKYFKNYKNELLKEFTFYHDIKNKAEDIRSLTKEPVISLHIRLGDYLYLPNSHPVCSLEYYKNALDALPKDVLIFIFSDDIIKAKEMFSFIEQKHVFPETNDKYIDMCLMNMCDYHIIANSSFSWWGAWLSNSQKIIAPSKWFGGAPNMPKNWSDVYCDDWIII